MWLRLSGGLTNHSFKRLAQACGLSSAGDALVAVALAGSIFFSEDPNTARERVALSLLLTMAPFAVVAPLLGPWVDRAKGGRRLVLMTAALTRAVLCLLMALSLDDVLLYPIAFGILVCSKTHAVAKSASVPEIVTDTNSLVRANSILSISAVLAGFVAAVAGYLVGQVFGDEWVLRVAALLFAVQAALVIEVAPVSAASRLARHMRAGRELRRAGVVTAAVTMASMRMSVGFLTFLIAFEFRRVDSPTWWFGLAVGASLVGSSLGNLAAPQLRGRIREEWILVVCVGSIALASLWVTQIDGLSGSVLLAFLVGFFAGAAKLAFDSLVQRDAPAAVHGRSFARLEAFFQLAWVVGAIVPVLIAISVVNGYIILAIGTASIATWYGLNRHNELKSAARL